ncbi:putative leucine-rich repeat receptor-like protein kinase, partial [Dichanthelium oligosanthes]
MMHLHLQGLLLLSCISLLLGAVIPAALAAGGHREAEALLRWKASLAGAEVPLSSWSLEATNSTSSPCNWAFVGCSSTGDMTMLNITNASIKGTLAGLDFSAFPRLETLILGQNDLYGTIPEGIGNLTNLASLRMYGQRLTGPIPRSIGQLKQLTVLQLAYLELNGSIPGEVGNLTSLEEMLLAGNSLTGLIPPAIGRLEKLSSLDLSFNNLKGSIPSEIGNMTNLQTMGLESNYFEGELPDTLSRLQKLGAIYVSDNQLRGRITQQLGSNNSNLNAVVIASNNFSGMLAGPICTLLLLVANNNRFASLQDLNFQNCTSLQKLDLARNKIHGDLNEWLGKLTKQLELTHLYLDENNITGEIPPMLGNMTSLWFLNLGHNQLTGAIPPELGKM